MKFGSSDIASVKLGSSNVSAIYVGSTQIYPTFLPPDFVSLGIQLYYNPQDPDSYPGTGTTVNDLSGNGYNGTLINGPTFSTNSFTLDGVNDYIATPNMVSSFNSTSAFTIEVWYKPAYTGQNQGGTVLQESGTSTPATTWYYNQFEFSTAPFGSLAYDYCSIWDGTVVPVNPPGTSNATAWRLITLTYDGVTGRSYRNGGPTFGSATVTRSLPWDNAAGYFYMIGAGSVTKQIANGINNFKGQIGIVRSYNRALDASEILQNYNGAKSVYGL